MSTEGQNQLGPVPCTPWGAPWVLQTPNVGQALRQLLSLLVMPGTGRGGCPPRPPRRGERSRQTRCLGPSEQNNTLPEVSFQNTVLFPLLWPQDSQVVQLPATDGGRHPAPRTPTSSPGLHLSQRPESPHPERGCCRGNKCPPQHAGCRAILTQGTGPVQHHRGAVAKCRAGLLTQQGSPGATPARQVLARRPEFLCAQQGSPAARRASSQFRMI